ncbi:MAG: bifunctional sulfate adenylyltransferase/adenylylsulfate kinase [bacterium]
MTIVRTPALIAPCGGTLVNLVVPAEARGDLEAHANRLPSIQLSEREACDLELLATGAFSPLDRFMGRADHQRVLDEMRLACGQPFPIPVTLSPDPSAAIRLDAEVALRDAKNDLLAVMTIEEVWEWDRAETARKVLGTQDPRHPVVAEMSRWGRLHVSGRLRVLRTPRRHDFQSLRLGPAQVRERLETLGHVNVVAFQTRNPLHRIHEELTKRAVREVDGALLLHPVVGMTKPGDVDHYTRVRTYRALVANHYDPGRTLLALLPLAMRMAGPREALWHAVIRRNYGANHLIVGRDHASPGNDSAGHPFYGPYDAQELVERFSAELGVGVVPFRELAYLPGEERYEEIAKIPSRTPSWSVSGTHVREEYLSRGKPLPAWLTRPEVAAILAEAHPPAHRRGVCIWLTGLSGSGKSTTAEILNAMLLERGRQVTLLDGDEVRARLSKDLGYSKQDRDLHVRRIGTMASEIVRHGGVVVSAVVSPYASTRDEVRAMVGSNRFVEVFVDTPLAVCEERDAKGLYAQARAGRISAFTGIDDPYEPPPHAEITLDTVRHSPGENAGRIVRYLLQRGFLPETSPSNRLDAGGPVQCEV